MEFIYNHTSLPASLIITSDTIEDADRIVSLISDEDESWRLDETVENSNTEA